MRKRKQYWILDADGEPQPTDRRTWAQWSQTPKDHPAQLVAVNWLKTPAGQVIGPDEQMGYLVSTMFLGWDDNHCGVGLPLLYETTLLGGPEEGPLRRYATRAEALAGHEDACQQLQAALDDEAT